MAKVKIPDSPTEKETKNAKANVVADANDTLLQEKTQGKKEDKTNEELKTVNEHLVSANQLLQQISTTVAKNSTEPKEKDNNKNADLSQTLAGLTTNFSKLSEDLKAAKETRETKQNALDTLTAEIKRVELQRKKLAQEKDTIALKRAQEGYARQLIQWERQDKQWQRYELQLQKEDEKRNRELYKETGLYRAGQEIQQTNKSPTASVMLELLSGGLLNSAVMNALGVDKLAKWAIQKPFKMAGNAWQKRKEENAKNKAAEEEENAEETPNTENTENTNKNSQNKDKSASTEPVIKDKSKIDPFNANNATNANKAAGKSSAATEKEPTEKLEQKLDAINESIKETNKPKEKEKKEEKGSGLLGILSMIMSAIGSAIGFVVNLIKDVANIGKTLLTHLPSIATGLAGAGAAIYAGKNAIDSFHHFQKGEYAEGAKEGLKAATTGVGALLGGLLGGPKGAAWGAAAAAALSEVADKVGSKIGEKIGDVATNIYDIAHRGEMAQLQAKKLTKGKDWQNYQNNILGDDEAFKAYEAKKTEFDLSSSKEQGVLWGKNNSEVKKRRKEKFALAWPVLQKHAPKIAQIYQEQYKGKRISKEEFHNKVIAKVDELYNMKRKEALARRQAEAGNTAGPASENGTTVNEGSVMNGTETIDTNSEQPSEDTIIAKKQQQTANENTQKLQESVTNATNQNNSVNQVNITEVNEKGVYDSGDAAKTMVTA